jgi:hypothetical protein
MHPDAVYPKDWSTMVGENKAGYISLELNETFAGYTQTAVNLAGLADVFKVGPHIKPVCGTAADVLSIDHCRAFESVID